MPQPALPNEVLGLENVLDVLAGLLELGGRLVGLALGLEALVVGRLADTLFDLAGQLFGLVVNLVVGSHRYLQGIGWARQRACLRMNTRETHLQSWITGRKWSGGRGEAGALGE